jgi:putative DNA methylase
MIPKECKRLAEVDFPIAVVSKHSAREKSIRRGHPSTLHLWWARRPLGACRSMLMALLLPDPCDPHCPADFKTRARDIFKQSRLAGRKPSTDEELRARLLHFIGDFADWDNAGHSAYLEVGRALVKAAHPEETPLVVDPFAGGGSIPLEALRLSCDAFASDLNPVACLITKVLLEDIPRHGPDLAEELRKVGAEVKKAAEKELADFYPPDSDGVRPIAYLLARTVRCEQAGCGSEIPLVRSFWLCKKAERRRALRVKNEAQLKPGDGFEFEIYTPTTENEVRIGTVSRAKATCLCCKKTLIPDRVRAQLAAQRGGADVVFDAKGKRTSGARLLAVVTARGSDEGREYRLPTDSDYDGIWKAHQRLAEVLNQWSRTADRGLYPIPNEEISLDEIRRISLPIYGITTWGDLFTSRQKLALNTHIRLQRKAVGAAPDYAFLISKLADTNSTVCTWQLDPPRLRATFNRQALPMTWDFAEACPIGEGAGNYSCSVEAVLEVVERRFPSSPGTAQQADACASPLPEESVSVVFTDPPYYDSVPYAHLSDFFYVWLKRTLEGAKLRLLEPTTTPKAAEIVVDRPHKLSRSKKTIATYQSGMARAFAEGRKVLRAHGIGSVVFAHKSTEGWESLLSGMISGGWTITGSWPLATELGSRMNAKETASLATSVHLVCRPRPEDAPVGDWGQVLRELPKRVADWMNRLQEEGVRGADLVFACIGPALEVYSRYSKVVDAEEREIPLGGDPEAREAHKRGFLAYVWEVVGRAALEEVLGTAEANARNGAAGALEEDARLTALFLWTLQATTQEVEPAPVADDDAEDAEPNDDDEDDAPTNKKKKKGLSLPFDVVRRFAQPLGTHLEAWEDRCIETSPNGLRTPMAARTRSPSSAKSSKAT